MECPKCHSQVADNLAVCPTCKKVLQLECPNCHALGQSSTCEKCGYTILVKCSKCSRTNPLEKVNCTKCGFPLKTSLAYQECESDDFAGLVVSINNLKALRKALKSNEMYTKFLLKIKNLLMAQLKNQEGKIITFGNSYVINMNKELSFPTSAHKAVRLAIKIINSYTSINSKLLKNLGIPLGLKISIIKKNAEELLDFTPYETNVKQLAIKKETATHTKGFQIEMDQFVWDQINKEYKTDSLYTMDKDGQSIMFYEIILDGYILPPDEEDDDSDKVDAMPHEIKRVIPKEEEKDLYSFKVFDINAKCAFERETAPNLIEKLRSLDLNKNGKIITLKSEKNLGINTADIAEFYKSKGYRTLHVCCTEKTTYKPWGVFEALFRDYLNLPFHNSNINPQKINPQILQRFKPLFELCLNKPIKAMTSEDARFAYMEHFGDFLGSLQNTVIIIEGFEYLDDTSIQTLELFFDKFKNVKPNFVFINTSQISLHSKIKGLLRTPLYTEISLKKASLDTIFTTLKSDATDFINSFYYEKLQENCRGSLLYFENVVEYLKESGVLIEFENKLLVKSNKSVVIPKDFNGLYKARIKNFSKNPDLSLIFAYSTILGERIDFETLTKLGVKDVEKQAEKLIKSKLARVDNDIIHINNFELTCPIIQSALKHDIQVFLAKNIMAHLGKGLDDTTLIIAMGILGTSKEEYLTLWKNSQLAINTGDFDAYLKNCLGFLSLVDKIKTNIEPEAIEENKKDVYNNILMCLYGYSPAKIYYIENMLLMDAIKNEDNEKIVKLSNLMLQGALISANYTDALGLLHNILSRMPNATWIVDGKVNTKFLLLSLVNIEILYNIGNFRLCVDIAEELLNIINYDILEEVKPASFSSSLFVSHILETLRLVGFAKLYLLDNDIEEFFDKAQQTLNVEFEEKTCILAIKDYLAGKVYTTGNIETASPFAKVIFLILQECSSLTDDYKTFAQNIYQAKLLATDIHQKEIEYFCDLLIAYAYFKTGVKDKAEAIYQDILQNSEKNAIFNMLLIAKYFTANLLLETNRKEEAMLLINDGLALLQKLDNQSRILFAIFEKLFIDAVKNDENTIIDLNAERQKLIPFVEALSLLLPKEELIIESEISSAEPQQDIITDNEATPEQEEKVE